ncbi:MAG: sodium-dependent transporter [Gammaproteobacteria bacterium]|nr:sodium-dependent transporter [Gammaproteobacteria bacterium]
MAERRESIHGQWSGRWAFILAATGSAVGLGNIWKFPYITGENGGGAFVLVYLLCIAIIGIPIMVAEVMLGRRGRRSPINTMRHLAFEERASRFWQYLGWAGVVAGFLILSYYAVIAGWAVAYIFRTASGAFTGATADGVSSIFSELIADPERLLAWHTIFMVITLVVVARGVRSGLEVAVRYLMPTLFVILLVLVGYAMNTGHFAEGVSFLFSPDFHALFYQLDKNGVEQLTSEPVLIALGHAFFTLSLGMGAIMVYGSYLPKGTSIIKTSVVIAAMDTLVALLAGLAIFPIVFANGLEASSGPGLIFQTLPIAFGHMPAGSFFGSLFFVLLAFAAWSSAISLIEPAVAWLVENHGFSRISATSWIGLGTWLLGIGTIFSFNIWSGEEYQLFGKTFFDLLDYLTANIMLPLGGLLIAVFAGWQMRRTACQDELGINNGLIFRGWYFLLRYISPVAVVIVFLNAIGLLTF